MNVGSAGQYCAYNNNNTRCIITDKLQPFRGNCCSALEEFSPELKLRGTGREREWQVQQEFFMQGFSCSPCQVSSWFRLGGGRWRLVRRSSSLSCPSSRRSLSSTSETLTTPSLFPSATGPKRTWSFSATGDCGWARAYTYKRLLFSAIKFVDK